MVLYDLMWDLRVLIDSRRSKGCSYVLMGSNVVFNGHILVSFSLSTFGRQLRLLVNKIIKNKK